MYQLTFPSTAWLTAPVWNRFVKHQFAVNLSDISINYVSNCAKVNSIYVDFLGCILSFHLIMTKRHFLWLATFTKLAELPISKHWVMWFFLLVFFLMFYICSATQSETKGCTLSVPWLFCYSKLKKKKKKILKRLSERKLWSANWWILYKIIS